MSRSSRERWSHQSSQKRPEGRPDARIVGVAPVRLQEAGETEKKTLPAGGAGGGESGALRGELEGKFVALVAEGHGDGFEPRIVAPSETGGFG